MMENAAKKTQKHNSSRKREGGTGGYSTQHEHNNGREKCKQVYADVYTCVCPYNGSARPTCMYIL